MDFKKIFFQKKITRRHRGTEGRNLCLLLFLLNTIISCVPNESTYSEFAFGILCNITFYDRVPSGTAGKIFSRIHEIENLMSVNIPSSDISRINAAAGIEPVQVHEDVFFVIKRAIYFAELSDGAFDPAIGPVVLLWNIGKENPRVPSREEIENVLPLVNWQYIELDENTNSVFLKYPNMALDLGAIAKGYAADEAARIAKSLNVKRCVIAIGGNVMLVGEKRDRTAWRVGIQNPRGQRGTYAGIVQAAGGQSIVTSGTYERFFESEGRQYHHIFSPESGYPAENDLLSVTIISKISQDADALSTAVFVMGYEKGRMMIESIPDTHAVFIFKDSSIRVTDGADFILTDDSFRFAK